MASGNPETEMTDDVLRERFVVYGRDLARDLRPAPDDHLFRLLFRAIRGHHELWRASGRRAMVGIAAGLRSRIPDSEQKHVRAWIALFEPMVRRLCRLGGVKAAETDNLGDVMRLAGVERQYGGGDAALAGALGVARLQATTDRELEWLLAVQARRTRNELAHARLDVLSWRRRVEVTEAIVVTLLRLLQSRRDRIEQALLWEELRPTSAAGTDIDWAWAPTGQDEVTTGSSAAFARALIHLLGDRRVVVLQGTRGVGLTHFALTLAAVGIADRAFVFMRLPLDEPEPIDRDEGDDAHLGALVGSSQARQEWFRSALRQRRLVLVVDGLGRVSWPRFVRERQEMERAFARHPGLRFVLLVADGSEVMATPHALGTLGHAATHVRTLARRCNVDELPPTMYLGYWIRQLTPRVREALGSKPDAATVVRCIVREGLGPSHPERWLALEPPLRRPAAAWIAARTLHHIARMLDEVADGDAVSVAMAQRSVYTAAEALRGDATGPLADKLDDAVLAALVDAGLLRSAGEEAYAIAHPDLEAQVWDEGFAGWTLAGFLGLSEEERHAPWASLSVVSGHDTSMRLDDETEIAGVLA